jgi:hypothetical protein
MSLRQRDYILRMIEQLAQALGALAGLRRAGKHDEAAELWQTTADGLFGPLLPMLDRLDAPSVALLLNDRDKLIAYAALVAERAAISEARGMISSSADHRRALALYLEAARSGPLDARSLADVASLRSKIDTR